MKKILDDLSNELSKLNESFFTFKQEICDAAHLNLDDQDARIVCLDQIQACLMGVRALLRLYAHVIEKSPNELKDIMAIPELEGRNIQREEKLKRDFDVIERLLRHQLINSIYFSIDNMFRNVYRSIKNVDISVAPKNFHKVLKEILLYLGQEQKEIEDVFTTFLNIRNSFHNNGIHRKENFNFTESFSFEKNKKIECASFSHIFYLLNNNIIVELKNILNQTSIKKIKFIKDDFSNNESN